VHNWDGCVQVVGVRRLDNSFFPFMFVQVQTTKIKDDEKTTLAFAGCASIAQSTFTWQTTGSVSLGAQFSRNTKLPDFYSMNWKFLVQIPSGQC
jgi:hypothetical protein